MDIMHSCRCCLRCPPDKDLTAPYVHLGKTEVYVDMLKDCFDLELTLNNPGSDGICWACVGRLRDASDFKLQVQRCQAKLQEALIVKVESKIKSELPDAREDSITLNMFDEVDIDNPEVSEDETEGMMEVDPLVKSEREEELPILNREDFLLDDAPDSPELIVNRPTKVYAKNKDQIIKEVETEERILLKPIKVEREFEENTSNPQKLKTEDKTIRILNREMSKDEEPTEKSAVAGEDTAELVCTDSFPVRAREQLAMNGSVVLERRRTDTTVHSRNIPYTCEHYGKQFNNKSILRKHITYKCSHCDYRYSHISNLRKHERTHTGNKPYKCSHCDYRCRSNLRQHERTHTGEKPHKCSHCDYRCNNISNLRQHERTHTGEKPYKCSHCDYRSNHVWNLRQHERTHTGEKVLV